MHPRPNRQRHKTWALSPLEPSLTTITSTEPWVCPRTKSIARLSRTGRFLDGMMTEKSVGINVAFDVPNLEFQVDLPSASQRQHSADGEMFSRRYLARLNPL